MTTTLAPFRAVSTLVLKSVDDAERVIEGVASSAATDAAGDVLEPRGASYQLPMPLLMQHDRNRPVGEVRAVKVTDSAIHIRARIARDSGLAYVEDAWRQLKAGLVKGLSIGAHPLKAEPILDRDGRMTGIRYTHWRGLELSAVTLPMNSDASIEMVRAFDPWGAEAFAAHHQPLIDQIPGAELADALEPVVQELEAMRDQVDALRGEPVAELDPSERALYKLTRARASAALKASSRVLDGATRAQAIAAPQAPSGHSYEATRARAVAALNLATRARAQAALEASRRAHYEVTRGRAMAALDASESTAIRTRAIAVLKESARVLNDPVRHRAKAALTASARALHRG